ncbi:hypothetical protein [Pseudoruegeria sp. SK021]
MTITREDELDGLKEIGRIVANTMHTMAKASRQKPESRGFPRS